MWNISYLWSVIILLMTHSSIPVRTGCDERGLGEHNCSLQWSLRNCTAYATLRLQLCIQSYLIAPCLQMLLENSPKSPHHNIWTSKPAYINSMILSYTYVTVKSASARTSANPRQSNGWHTMLIALAELPHNTPFHILCWAFCCPTAATCSSHYSGTLVKQVIASNGQGQGSANHMHQETTHRLRRRHRAR